jgi:hypothetical protein
MQKKKFNQKKDRMIHNQDDAEYENVNPTYLQQPKRQQRCRCGAAGALEQPRKRSSEPAGD